MRTPRAFLVADDCLAGSRRGGTQSGEPPRGAVGDLFTNVGDITNEPLVSRDKENMVWVGSENRQHILGHIGLLGPALAHLPDVGGGTGRELPG